MGRYLEQPGEWDQQMKMIGLLGGMSWEPSMEYERLINEEVCRRLGGSHSANLLIRSYDFWEIEALQKASDWGVAGSRLVGGACLTTPVTQPSPLESPVGDDRCLATALPRWFQGGATLIAE